MAQTITDGALDADTRTILNDALILQDNFEARIFARPLVSNSDIYGSSSWKEYT